MKNRLRNDWQIQALDRLWRRIEHATAAADVGALLREAARIAGCSATLPSGVALPTDEVLARFGLRAEVAPGGVTVHQTGSLPASLPVELQHELTCVLPVDPELRRPDVPASADAVLTRLTRYSRYRNPTQKAAVRTLLTMPPGAALLTTMATGTGKSLLFQIGIQWWREHAAAGERPCAVVLVPTVSLALNHRNAAAALPRLEGSRALTGDSHPVEREAVRLAFLRGEVPLLFISPEAALGTLREDLIRAAAPMSHPGRTSAAQGHVCAVFVDEAHIVASWGRSFRPDLQRIPGLVRAMREANPELKTVLLSATVDDVARSLLHAQYGEAGPWLEVAEGVPRREFDFVQHRFQQAKTRDDAVLALTDALPRPALIYTTERDDAAMLERRLRERGFHRLALFTGDTDGGERERIVAQWRDGGLDLVVATSAFGMGIDQDEVRAVVHACLPEDASRYYQEIGRAGRDGHQAVAILLEADEDEDTARGLIARSIMSVEKAQPRWRALRQSAVDAGVDAWTGRPRFRLDLDARGEHLEHEHTGRRNRTWNKSLLVQLQRYGGLEVVSSEQDDRRWEVVFQPNHVALADPGTCAAEIDALFEQYRDDEARRALRAVDAFARIWNDEDACCLASVFAMVEAGDPTVGACGRCFACRAWGERPNRGVHHGGTSARWPAPARASYEPARLLLAGPATLPARWMEFLAGHGVQQVVVPERHVDAACTAWVQGGGDPGWVLSWDEVLGTRSEFVPLPVPTALVLPGAAGPDVDQAWRWRQSVGRAITPVAWIVAPPGTRVGGRNLEDVASIRAPVLLGR